MRVVASARAVSLSLASHGAKIVVNDIGADLDGSGGSNSHADEVVGTIKDAGGDAVASVESVTTWEGGERIVQAALDSFGQIDIVVTAAGILRDRMIYNMSEEEWDAVIDVHLKGTFSVCRHAAPIFRQQRGGRDRDIHIGVWVSRVSRAVELRSCQVRYWRFHESACEGLGQVRGYD